MSPSPRKTAEHANVRFAHASSRRIDLSRRRFSQRQRRQWWAMTMRSLIDGYLCRAMLKGCNSAKYFKNYHRIILLFPRIEFSIKNDSWSYTLTLSDSIFCVVCLWNVFDFVICSTQGISYIYSYKISLRIVAFQCDSHKIYKLYIFISFIIFISFLEIDFKNVQPVVSHL